MPTLKGWIEEMAEGEPVEGVVIGGMAWDDDYRSDEIPGYAEMPKNVVLTWDVAAPLLTYEFSDGYGAPECQTITAWTRSWVIAVSQYDGSTSPFRLARNPTDHEPVMPGGG